MVKSVTNKPRGAQLRALGRPQVALNSGLSKPLGEPFTFSWPVVNNGGTQGWVRFSVLDASVSPNTLLVFMDFIAILPTGVPVTLAPSWTPPFAGTFSLSFILQEVDVDNNPIRTLASDTGIITAAAGPQLEPMGSPTIS